MADDNIPSQKYRDTGIPQYFMTSSLVDNSRKNPRVQIICNALTDSFCHMLMTVCLKSDGTTGQTTGHLEVDTPRATVPTSTCDRQPTGHWPVAMFKRRDRRRDTLNCPSIYLDHKFVITSLIYRKSVHIEKKVAYTKYYGGPLVPSTFY